jgi:exonuclease SbcC
MLNELEIRNYQSHKHTSLSFHPGMNVITGTSDSGKSAIMRSMLWALKNRPAGESFKNWGASATDVVDVSMEFDNDYFTKSRIKGKNSYETETDTYEALRSDVPDAINAIANITDYNIQTQFQPYFMLQDSAGDRAKQLNTLVGLDIIDSLFKKLNGKIQVTKTSVKSCEGSIVKIQEQIDSVQDLTSIVQTTDRMTLTIDSYEKMKESVRSLSESIGKLVEIDRQITEKSEILKSERPHHLLQNKVESHQIDKLLCETLAGDIKNLVNTNDNLDDDVEWLQIEKPYTSLINKCKERSDWQFDLKDLNADVNVLLDLTNKIRNVGTDLSDIIKLYTDKLAEEKVCPTCMSKIGSLTLENIKRSLA